MRAYSLLLLLLALSFGCEEGAAKREPPESGEPDGGDANGPSADASAARDGSRDANAARDADASRGTDAGRDAELDADVDPGDSASEVDPSLPAVTEGEGKIYFPTPYARTESEQTLFVGCVAMPATASAVRLGARAVSLDARGCFRQRVPTPLGRTIVDLTVQRGGASAAAGRVELLHEFAPLGAFPTAYDPARGRVYVVDASRDGYELLEVGLMQGVDRLIAKVPEPVQIVYDVQSSRLLALGSQRLLSVNVETGEQMEKPLDLGTAFQSGAIALDGAGRVLYALRQTSIVAIEIDSGRVRTLHRGGDDESVLEGLAFYPASRELFTVRSGFAASLLAFHADTGAQRTIANSLTLGNSLAIVGDRLYLNGGTKLAALALPNGAPVELAAAPPYFLSTLVAGDRTLVGVHEFGIERIDPATGASEWLRGYSFPGSSLPLGYGGHFALDEPRAQLFFATGGEVRAFDLNTGKTRTILPSAVGVARDAPPSLIDLHRTSGQLYAVFTHQANYLVRVDPSSGVRTMAVDLRSHLAGKLPQALVAQGAFAYVALANAPTVLRVDLSSGEVQAKTVELGSGSRISDLAVDDRATRLFVVEVSGDVAEHDYDSFERKARHTTNGSVNDGSAAFDAETQTLWVLDNNNGTGFHPIPFAGAQTSSIRPLFGSIRDAPFAIYHGQFLALSDSRLWLQDSRGEQRVELYRPR